MCKMPKQNKISIPLEIRISTRVFLNLVVAYSLVWFVINAMTDGLGEIGYASAIMAFAIVLGGVFKISFIARRGGCHASLVYYAYCFAGDCFVI